MNLNTAAKDAESQQLLTPNPLLFISLHISRRIAKITNNKSLIKTYRVWLLAFYIKTIIRIFQRNEICYMGFYFWSSSHFISRKEQSVKTSCVACLLSEKLTILLLHQTFVFPGKSIPHHAWFFSSAAIPLVWSSHAYKIE